MPGKTFTGEQMRSLRAAILASACVLQCGVGCWTVLVRAQQQPPQQRPTQQPPQQPAPRQDPSPAFTAISAIRALTPQAANSRHRVRIRGTITYINEREPAGMIVHDGEAGLFVHYGDFFVEDPPVTFHPGDIVDVSGYTTGHGFAPAIVPDDVKLVGRGPLPVAKQMPYAALLSGGYDCAYIEIVGVGQRAWLSESGKTLFVDVAVEGGVVRAWFWHHAPEDLTRFVDARIRLRGNAGTLFNQARQVRGIALFGGRASEAEIDTPAPDPWSLPVRAISSLYTHQAKEQSDRRVRLHGTVTATRVGQPVFVEDLTMHTRSRVVRHEIYIRDATSGALIETEQPFTLAPGDIVDIAGFPVVSSTKPRLQNAVVHRAGHHDAPAPRTISVDTLLGPAHDSELVRIEGHLLTAVETSAGRSLVLRAGNTVFEAIYDPSSWTSRRNVPAGTLVSVSGVYVFESGPPPAFHLLLRSPADVVVLASPPWWTPQHSLVLAAFVAAILIAGLIWARMHANRHAAVQRQYRAIIAERSRLASELHDTLEQGLAGIQLQLGAVAKSLDTSPQNARRALGIASEMLRYSLSEARRSVMDLRHGALDTRDLAGALSDVARQMTTGTSLQATVRMIGAARPLQSADEHHLLRIGLEALTNAIKHSGAARVDVALRFADDAVHLVVTDDGSGFTTTRLEHVSGHFGLRGIRERVDKMGGALTLENQPEGGAVVAVRIPLNANGANGARAEAHQHG
jgi:signal transduction histidine kinase